MTANDNCDSDNGVNRTQNYPILTSANASGGNLTLAGTLNSAANTAFTVDFYISPACDASGNGEGQTYLGSATVTTNAACTASLSASVPLVGGIGTRAITATATDPAGNTSEFSACRTVVFPNIQFSAPSFTFNENAGVATINVTRTGDTSTPASVAYRTVDVPGLVSCAIQGTLASPRCDYGSTNGTLSFAATEAAKSFSIPLIDDFYQENTETVQLELSSPTGGATLGAPATATLNIESDDIIQVATRRFAGYLDRTQEVPPTNSNAKGGGSVTLNDAETMIEVSLTFAGLGSAQTAAHIHGPALAGRNGPIIFTLPLGNFTNQTFNVTPAQVAQLKSGMWYFNVHSANFPNGEIRGQILNNPVEFPPFFVRQQYGDFLSREPDQGGLNFWTSQITDVCLNQGGDLLACISQRRVAVSNAFFFELEYQQTGAYTYRLYRAAFGNTQPFANPMGDDDTNPYCLANPNNCQLIRASHVPSYEKFAADRARLDASQLAATQLTLATQFTARAEFTARYPLTQSGAQFVDALIANIQAADGANLTGQRDNLINLFNNGGRGAVMFRLAEDNAAGNPVNNRAFIDAEYNRAFVTTQYYGYLRRDADMPGLNFWLSVVNQFPLRSATGQNGMVCAFITSAEYQLRFSPVSPRTNQECQ